MCEAEQATMIASDRPVVVARPIENGVSGTLGVAVGESSRLRGCPVLQVTQLEPRTARRVRCSSSSRRRSRRTWCGTRRGRW